MPQAIVEGFTLSPHQEHLWRLLGNASPQAFQAFGEAKIEGRLDPGALHRALRRTLERHEILRTAFRRPPAMKLALQVITENTEPRFEHRDFTELPEGEQEAAVEAWFRAVKEEPAEIETGSPLTIRLATLSPSEHRLLLVLPGLCADVPTLDNLLREIGAACARPGPDSDGEQEEPIQYADAAQVFLDILEGDDAETAQEFWRGQKLTRPVAVTLPLTDRFSENVTGSGFLPQVRSLALGPETVRRAAEVGEGAGVGAGILFLAVWQLLLQRLTERPDLVVAAVFDGRRHEGLDQALGLFARTLPVPCRAASAKCFAKRLEELRQVLESVGEWQESFVWRLLSGEENGDGLPFWPFVFELGEAPEAFLLEASEGPLRFVPGQRRAVWDRFELKLVLELGKTEGKVSFEYDAARVGDPLAQRVASDYRALLMSALDDPRAAVADLSFLSRAERHQILVEWNDTRVTYAGDERLHHLFEAQAERTPDAAAVIAGSARQMSYRELNRRTNRLAHRLRELGVGPEVLVAICRERSPAMVVSILAVLKAGGAYLPLDPGYPRDRLAFMLADAQAPVLLTGRKEAASLPATGAEVLFLEDGGQEEGTDLMAGLEENPVPLAAPDQVAYVIYTSGSTGTPKGVQVSHRAIRNRVVWMHRTFPLGPEDALLQKTPYSFDASIWEIFAPLLAGARLVLAGPDDHRDPARMAELIADHGITRLQLVPSMLGGFLDQPELDRCTRLNHVFCGGEALTTEHRDRLFERLDAELCNLYGPTETAIDASFWPCHRGDRRRPVPIGRPLDNSRILVLDRALRLLPPGLAGGLYIGGVGLARGYLGRSGLTAERFVPDPWSSEPGARLYDTGDLARALPDGTVECLGRRDRQIKLRGFRIELGEIESALAEHPAVGEAAALARPTGDGRLTLAAYVAPSPLGRLLTTPTHALPRGLEVAFINRGEAEFIHHGIFEDPTYLQHGVTLEDGDCVFDVGANIGLFTIFVHQVCRNSRVLAFEPIPEIFDRLRRNVALYDLPVELFNYALGAAGATTSFTFYPQWSAMSGAYADRQEDEAMARAVLADHHPRLARHVDDLLVDRFLTETYSCRVRSLSDVMAELGIKHIDLLKIDVEKAELEVLRGIAEEDWGKIRQVVVEAHDRGSQLEAMTALLEGHGFELVVEQNDLVRLTDLYHVYAVHPSRRRPSPAAMPVLRALERRRPLSAEVLVEHLAARLPEFMVPARFVVLDALPRLPNGKIDRDALPSPESFDLDRTPRVPPCTPEEKTLAEIWCELLGRDDVGIHDSFFELGGDSILSIQVVTRAQRAGFHFTAQDVFRHQTIARLAVFTGANRRPEAAAEVIGPVPLTPAQRRFFELDLPSPHHFNQSLLLEVHRPLEHEPFERALAALVTRHGALRLRFKRGGEGWLQELVEPDGGVPLEWIDLSGLARDERPAAIEARAAEVQASLDLGCGPLMRVAFFDLGAEEPGRLLVVLHHLVVDGVSWRILLEDLETAYADASDRLQDPRLPAMTTPFSRWAARLAEHSATGLEEGELAYWLDEARREVAPLPRDLDGGRVTAGSVRTVNVTLGAERTRALLREVPPVYRTEINDVLLAALALALARWTGRSRLLVDLEGHGREALFEDVDLSRTVGWFTTVYPLFLDLGGVAGDGLDSPGETLKAVKETLRSVPQRGIGYGLLRYLSDSGTAVRLAGLPQAEVAFNYLGQLDRALADSSAFAAAAESSGPVQDGAQTQPYLLEIVGSVAGGELRLSWNYSSQVHRRGTIEALAKGFIGHLESLIDHCLDPDAGGITPSDVPLAGLDQGALDRLLTARPEAGRDVVDIYPLSPLQQGLLFHSLDDASSRLYFRQISCTLEGKLDANHFRRAWQKLVERHAILRTEIVWEGLDRPLQVVRQRPAVVFDFHDWQDLAATEREGRWQALADGARQRGIDIGRAPLMRLELVRTAPRVHEFLWNFHHLISDGWSLPLLIEELFQLYEGLRGGELPQLEEPRPYSDYIAWLERQDLASAEAFWRRNLAGFSAPTALGGDRLMPEAKAPKTKRDELCNEHLTELSIDVTTGLGTLAREHRLTLNTVIQGAWALLLHHVSGERDLLFGAVTSGRPAELEGVESMIGVFINTLPVRLAVEPGASLAAWLGRLQESQAEVRRFEFSPLAQIQSWSEVPRGQPLFESLMAFENYPVASPLGETAGTLRVRDARFVEHTNYPLTLVTGPGSSTMGVKVMYDRRIFDSTTVERRLRHLESLLASFAARPEGRLDTFSPLSLAERHQLLYEWNDTATLYPGQGSLIHGLFEARAARTPNAPAVESAEARLTYGELNRLANRLAHYLRFLGVGPGSLVAVHLERQASLIPALLGILKAGGAYVPMSSHLPRARCEWILSNLGIETLVTHASRLELAAELAGSLGRVCCLDPAADVSPAHRQALTEAGVELSTAEDLEGWPEDDPAHRNRADDLAYVIFTSGSTGAPKGVVEQHRPVVNLIDWVNRSFGVGVQDRVLFVTSLSFDLSVYDIFGLLAAGGVIRMASSDELRDPGRLAAVLCEEPITFWDSAPAALQQLVPFLPLSDGRPAGGAPSLRLVFLSGDWIPLTLPGAMGAAFKGTRVIGLGGATEATVWSNFFPVRRVEPDWPSIPYGRPIWNARYHVLDRRFEPSPIGVPGDLYIGGGCLALQYAREPAMTGEKFRPDPFGGRAGERLYRTGDRARYLPDGNIQFLGRLDHQVKIRGFRIELGEIETVLLEHSAVREAVVLARCDEPGEQRLVAYLIPGEESLPGSDELRRFLARKLPDYMLPAAFVELEELPLTANGKLDRAALPAPGAGRPELSQEYVEPHCRVEEQLAAIWSQVLRVERVGARDNFFDLGGDSILSIQIISRASQMGLRLSPAQVFEHPTVAELAAVAEIGRRSVAEQGLVTGPVPLTPVQRWFFDADLVTPSHFNQAVMLEVREALAPGLLAHTLDRLLRHHDALRLRFTHGEDGWRQHHADAGEPPPAIAIDLSRLPDSARRVALETAADEVHASLDLEHGPLLRLAWLDLGPASAGRLLIVAHHLVMDGVSWRILLEDLETVYQQLGGGEPVDLPPKTTSYRRAAERLAEADAAGVFAVERAYWLAEERWQAPRLPVDFSGFDPPRDNRVANAETLARRLGREETAALLQEVPKAYHTQINDALLTALFEAFRCWTGGTKLLVDLESHGRQELFDDVDLSRTVGWFTAIHPVLLNVAESASAREILRTIKEELRQVPSHGVGYGVLRYLAAGATAELAALPPAEVSFNYLGQVDQALSESSPFRAARESSGLAQSLWQPRRHLLEVTANVFDGELRVAFTFSEKIHRRATIEHLADDFITALRALVDQCLTGERGFTPSDFPLVDDLDQLELDNIISQVQQTEG